MLDTNNKIVNAYYKNLLNIIKKKSFKQGNFTLSSGEQSNYFIDCKQSLLTADGHYWAGIVGFEYVKTFPMYPKAIAGVAIGGCSLANAISHHSVLVEPSDRAIDSLYVRKESKDHGTKKLVEGPELGKYAPVLLVEDVITTGKSVLLAANVLKSTGYEVIGILSVIDRGQGASEMLSEELDIPVKSFYKLDDLMC